jgi:hypothetical protein
MFPQFGSIQSALFANQWYTGLSMCQDQYTIFKSLTMNYETVVTYITIECSVIFRTQECYTYSQVLKDSPIQVS